MDNHIILPEMVQPGLYVVNNDESDLPEVRYVGARMGPGGGENARRDRREVLIDLKWPLLPETRDECCPVLPARSNALMRSVGRQVPTRPVQYRRRGLAIVVAEMNTDHDDELLAELTGLDPTYKDALRAIRDTLRHDHSDAAVRKAFAIYRTLCTAEARNKPFEMPGTLDGDHGNHDKPDEYYGDKGVEGGAGYDPATEHDIPWGRLTVKRLALTQALPARKRARRWASTAEGAIPRSMHRAITDQAVFARRVRHPGGSVLIDRSGSMSLSVPEIEQVMTALPDAIIGAYGGDGSVGELHIIADKGRRAQRSAIDRWRLLGNVVDGPALKWLGEQPLPRYWICDGVVTGQNDSVCLTLKQESEMIRRKYAIERFETIEEALAKS